MREMKVNYEMTLIEESGRRTHKSIRGRKKKKKKNFSFNNFAEPYGLKIYV